MINNKGNFTLKYRRCVICKLCEYIAIIVLYKEDKWMRVGVSEWGEGLSAAPVNSRMK